jgi:diguanylate cyclase (GGDEF)-like protein/PAS domain S-box-containing protein
MITIPECFLLSHHEGGEVQVEERLSAHPDQSAPPGPLPLEALFGPEGAMRLQAAMQSSMPGPRGRVCLEGAWQLEGRDLDTLEWIRLSQRHSLLLAYWPSQAMGGQPRPMAELDHDLPHALVRDTLIPRILEVLRERLEAVGVMILFAEHVSACSVAETVLEREILQGSFPVKSWLRGVHVGRPDIEAPAWVKGWVRLPLGRQGAELLCLFDREQVNEPSRVWTPLLEELGDFLKEGSGAVAALEENVPVMLMATARDGSLLYANNAWWEFTGLTWTASRLRPDRLHLVHPQDREHIEDVMAMADLNHQNVRLTVRLRHRSGIYRWVLHEVATRPNGGMYIAMMDVHEDKQRQLLEEALHALDEEMAHDRASRDSLRQLCTRIAHVIDAPLVWLAQWQDTRITAPVVSDTPQAAFLKHIPMDAVDQLHPAATALAQRSALWLHRDDPELDAFRQTMERFHIGGWLVIPLGLGAERTALVLHWSEKEHAFDPMDVASLESIAPRLGTAIIQLQQQQHLQLLGAGLEAVADPIVIIDRRGTLVHANRAFCQLYRLDPSGMFGVAVAELGLDLPPLDLLEGVVQMVVTSGGRRNNEITVTGPDGQLLVVEQTVAPVPTDEGEAQHFILVQHDLAEKKRAEYLANYDVLTGLPNRESFLTVLEAALRNLLAYQQVAVLSVGIHGFRALNEAYGMRFGDQLLQILARHLEQLVLPQGTVARVGGDEFGILLPEASMGAVSDLALRIRRLTQQDLYIGEHRVALELRIGLTMGQAGGDAERLLREAALAMHSGQDKEQHGEQGFATFSPELDASLRRRMALINEMRAALAERRFVVLFQPLVRLATRRLDGVEALVRLKDAQGRFISPVEFIPLAEETGLIGEIGAFVLQESLAALGRWLADPFLKTLEPRVSVNVSPIQLRHADFGASVKAAVTAAGVPYSQLKLEITESTLMEDRGMALAIMRELSEEGVCFVIDDFGTGYSSLAYL